MSQELKIRDEVMSYRVMDGWPEVEKQEWLKLIQ
jgi:hypothetical protein